MNNHLGLISETQVASKNYRLSIDSNMLSLSQNRTTSDQLEIGERHVPLNIHTTVEFRCAGSNDNLSNVRLYSESDLQRRPSFSPSSKLISFAGPLKCALSPSYSQTAQDLEQSSQDIQLVGCLSCDDFSEIPNIMLAIRKKPLFQESTKVLSNNTSLQVSPVKTRVQSKTHSVLCEFEEDNMYSIWEDEEGKFGPIQEESVEFLSDLEQFLILYKMRSGTYPKRRTHLENERVIMMAINLARIDRKLYKKYFPTKNVRFNDDTDYTKTKFKAKRQKQQTVLVTPLYQYVQQ